MRYLNDDRSSRGARLVDGEKHLGFVAQLAAQVPRETGPRLRRWLALGPRMRSAMRVSHMIATNVRVDLSGRDARMPEHGLHAP